ncbi:MAG: hypothetical protein WCE44_07895 [Candidatus Velthaea sp.]
MRRPALVRIAIVAALCLTFALQSTGADISLAALIPGLDPTTTPLAVTLDGKSLGPIALARSGAPPLVNIEALAGVLKWHVTLTPTGAILDDGSGPRALRVGSRFVHEEGTNVELFDQPLVARNGHLMLAFSDTLALFGLNGTFSAKGVVLTSSVANQTDVFTTKEVVAPLVVRATPQPLATPPPTFGSPFDAGMADMSVSVSLDGASHFYQVGLASNTNLIRAHVNDAGVQTLGTPNGTVTLGSVTRNESFGEEGDPLGGMILQGNGFAGATWFSRTGPTATTVIAGRRTDGRTIVGVTRELPGSNLSNTIAVVSNNRRYEQTVFRHDATYRPKWGTLSEELLVSERGVGAGITAQTHGRSFVISTVSFATGGLPVGADSSPVSIALGRYLTPATTVTTGLSIARETPLSTYVGIQTSGPHFRLFANETPHAFTFGLSYLGSLGNAQLLVEPGVNRLLEFQSELRVRSIEADIDASTQSTSSQADVEFRTMHPGINVVTGFTTLTGGRSGPILGLSIPVFRNLAIEVSERPGTIGNRALRFSLHAGLPARRPRIVTYPLTVDVTGPADVKPLRLLIDGVPSGLFSNGIREATVRVTQGQHDVFVEALDGASGSPSHEITLKSAMSLQLTLFPERVISGRVRFNARPAEIPPEAALSDVKLTIDPGGIIVEADADGNFLFPRQPLDPNALLSVDPDTLPFGFVAPEPIRVGSSNGPVDVPISPRPVERQVFH